MAGPHPAVAQIRSAVRPALADSGQPVLVACSGGADSLALAAALAFEAPRAGVAAGAVTVDHGLQPGSAERAESTAALLRHLGLDPVDVVRVAVGRDGGPEAAARTARYAALRTAAAEHGARIALGHTLDDQAETVLLGLGRGSGPRSVAGMVAGQPAVLARRSWASAGPPPAPPVPRRNCPCGTTRGTTDPAYTRVRLRTEALPLLEEVLGGGVRRCPGTDGDAAPPGPRRCSTRWPTGEFRRLSSDGGLPATELAALHAALRRRVLRHWLREQAIPDLQGVHLAAVDALLTRWHGQGPVALPGGAAVVRASGRLVAAAPDDDPEEHQRE